jgi:hypothetical protein
MPGAERWGGTTSRREFLKVGAAASLAGPARWHEATSPSRSPDGAVILLVLVGGPSQLETFDPKPDAPGDVRGPFSSIATAVPGVRITEHLPKLARRLDRVALVRSIHHDAAPIHETGLQLLQTGRLCRLGDETPHLGPLAARAFGAWADKPSSVFLPGRVANTGVDVSHGDTAGELGSEYEPSVPGSGLPTPGLARILDDRSERASVREAYGPSAFGRACLAARRAIEAGVRVVTVTAYQDVFRQTTWDCHGSAPFSTLDDYRRSVLPNFDAGFSALLDDLEHSGRLDSTLIVATGEFGRSPRLNAAGGRDHWPSVWSAVVAGGGVRGGAVLGASDAHAAEPADRPVPLVELHATMLRRLGLSTNDFTNPLDELFS